ncbi:cell division protein FtsH [Candidatus Marinamargulisbacteria bacterium SCGC AG-343-D04]|nr:cell division protein FtsH [Candidatus Marinamargulisbacteria bacterium SCGC AG-343-D04]
MAPIKKKNKKDSNQNKQKKEWRNAIWYFLIGLMFISIISSYFTEPAGPKQATFSYFISQLNQGNLQEVTLRTSEQVVMAKTTDGEVFKTYYINYPNLISELQDQNINIKINPQNSNWLWGTLAQIFLPFLLILLLWFFIFRQAQGMNNQAMSFGKSKASPWRKDEKQKTTFKDVAGVDEAVEELREIVDFLKKPDKYKDIGAKIPKGALLMGPPGTGKTLLAKAIAGEADVPFFSISGSEFVEMFVGVGASRVRDLFNQAKKNQPCLIFVDEIDAVGRHRGAGLGGGHDEREQTLNQLLVEMDGFDPKQTIIIIAATNRPDILDPALLRPGRFDRQVTVPKPDIKGRLEILNIHSQEVKMEKNIDLEVISRGTPGFTGADLANLVNEGTLLAARKNKKLVRMADLEEAMERVIAGPQRKSRVMSDHEKKVISYHEVGHALVAAYAKDVDPVHKISILPRGQALGYTLQLPIEDKYLMSKTQILSTLEVLMGGRAAEEIVFKEITSGASNDIERATELSRALICTYGMSSNLGTRKYGQGNQQVFLGKMYGNENKDYSDQTAKTIDDEIQSIINTAYTNAKKIILKHRKTLDTIATILLETETIDKEEFEKLLGNKKKDTKKETTKKEVSSKTN